MPTMDLGSCHVVWVSADEKRRSPLCEALSLAPECSIRSLPLLPVASCRSDVDSPAFARLRRGIAARGDLVITLRPLNRNASAALIHQMPRAEPGPGLRALAASALGIRTCCAERSRHWSAMTRSAPRRASWT